MINNGISQNENPISINKQKGKRLTSKQKRKI